MAKTTRREAREQAFALIFEQSFHPEIPVETIIESAKEARIADISEFAKQLANGVENRLDQVDEKIEKYAIGWRKSRISKVALAILRLAVYEIRYEQGIPVSVSINEAVELAKKFAGEEDASFINGVLGSVASEEGEEPCTVSE